MFTRRLTQDVPDALDPEAPLDAGVFLNGAIFDLLLSLRPLN
jgi:hypothetical protein